MTFNEFQTNFLTFVQTSIEPKKDDGYPVCPYARSARMKQTLQFIDAREDITTLESFDPVIALDSPDGDITLPKEFEFNSDDNTIILSNVPALNTKVTVIKKTGQTWTNTGEMLGDAENSIARFLRAGTSALPE